MEMSIQEIIEANGGKLPIEVERAMKERMRSERHKSLEFGMAVYRSSTGLQTYPNK